MIEFEYEQDREFFDRLFGQIGGVEKYAELFDFSDPSIKRERFNKIRDQIFEDLRIKFGDICMLKFHEDCSNSAEQVDHLIPLSSNVLNKSLRKMKGENGKKVTSQSFGSNQKMNFVLSCARCNAAKKHRLPDAELLLRCVGS